MARDPVPPQEDPPPAPTRIGSAAAELRERFDAPIAQATRLADWTLARFPVRVWRLFLQHNGFVLAAGVSYQAIFAVFAAVYVAFALVGMWFGGSESAVGALIAIINGYVPSLIGPDGVIAEQQVEEIATGSAGVLSITGAIALGVLVWTAIGFVTYARRAVRDLLSLPHDPRNYVLLKTRDFVAALVFGGALLAASILGAVATWSLEALLSALSLTTPPALAGAGTRILSLAVSLAVNAGAIAGFIRFIIGVNLPWRVIMPGSLAGGAVITVLQIGAGTLLSASPRNPLLATFALLVGMLLWFRLTGIVLLVATAWISVSARDRDLELRTMTEDERMAEERAALLLAARVRVREATAAVEAASWTRRFGARRRLRQARDELARLEGS